jgi:Kdo2-lipid IVA lauroyltransferase/acyltransferase
MSDRKVSASSPLLGALARVAFSAGAALPLPVARALGALLGGIGGLLPNQFRRVSRFNLEWCFPELTDRQRRALLRSSLVATGRTTAEAGPVFTWSVERLRSLILEVEGEELLDRALARAAARGGAGPVLLLPHLGNWEMVNPFLMAKTPFVALYRPPRITELEEVIARGRERTGCRMVPATAAGLRELFAAVRGGRAAIILPDQEPVRRSGVFAPLFGIPALTMTLVPRLLRRVGSEVLFIYARRTGGGFSVHVREAPEGIDDADPVTAARALNLGVERCVRECPEQYMWSYKRFKTRPDEELHRLNVLRDPRGVKLYRRRPYPRKRRPRVSDPLR